MNVDELCINTIRMLAVDQVEQAKSGHPGMPLGAAPMAYALWSKVMRHNPRNPSWFNRDRFVLSAGHGSALLYSLLHLSGYDLPLNELKNFRQYESKTPGHPEYGCAPGVEATTGPLGQGFAMGVGMAMAERFLATRYNREGANIVDHYTYAIVSDGDLMEGVASEAASLAGHLKLGKLIYLYDDNHISIEGDTNITFTESVAKRFESYGWHVQAVADGNDVDAIEKAVRAAKERKDAPSIIAIRTHIGFGSPKQDNASVHGEPLGEDGARKTRERLGWKANETFHVPEEAKLHFMGIAERGLKDEDEWKHLLDEFAKKHPEEAKEFGREIAGELPNGWDSAIAGFTSDKPVATRAASGKVINALAKAIPNFIGGSADLAPSNKTHIDDGGERNIHFGIREHAMGAVVNGMALHGGVIPFGATFLVFSDYLRPSIRLAALMNAHSIFVFTHDSIGLGEDGPTHQPIEHIASLRTIPNLVVFRPADANETAASWKFAVEEKRPVAFALSRQNLPVLEEGKYPVAEGVKRGAYVLSDCDGTPQVILIATGSEVQLALEAKEKMTVPTRVVSMPSWELFGEQPQSYRDEVLPPAVTARLAIEAGSTLGWHRWVGDKGDVIGIDRFGCSAPARIAFEKYGFTVDNVVKKARTLIG